MDANIRQSNPPVAYAEADLLVDRRRPSRAETDRGLAPVPRQTGRSGITEFAAGPGLDLAGSRPAMDRDSDGNVAKGIIFGLMLSMPFWVVTALVGVMVLR